MPIETEKAYHTENIGKHLNTIKQAVSKENSIEIDVMMVALAG